jgi:hypothetical protein
MVMEEESLEEDKKVRVLKAGCDWMQSCQAGH